MTRCLTLLLLTLLTNSLNAQALTLYSQSIPGLFQEDKKGAYDQVIKHLTQDLTDFKHAVMPNNRAYRAFSHCQNCCYSPANLNSDFYDFGEDIVATQPINTAKAYIISLTKSRDYFTELSQLSDKVVGLERGINYGKAVADADFTASITNSLLQNFNMLLINRIDALIAYAPDIYQAFKIVDGSQFQYQPEHPLAIHKDALVCRGVGPKFIQNFNSGLKQLKQSGQLRRILGETYVAP